MILHYGDIRAADPSTTAICGAHAPSSITFREYELEPGANEELPYLRDTEPCTACWAKLRPRVEHARADLHASLNADVRELVAYNDGRLPSL